MELPDLGKQCGVESCRQLDFLPIVCGACGGVFCKEHSLPFYHQCVSEAEEEKTREEGDDRKITRHPCQFPKCDGGELTPVLCPACGLNFCLAHRHQPDHQCPHQPQQGPSEQEKAAAEKIKQIADRMDGGGGGERRGKGKKSEQLSAKVQLMKLKQKSEGEKGIPSEERIYLLVSLPPSSSSSSSSLAVFVSRAWSIGRAIDSIASIAKLKNQNNITSAPKLRLFHPTTKELLGPPEQLLGDLIATQVLFNGQSVLMGCVAEGLTSL
ncbi:AN1-type zinc finger protein 1-like [Eriocheir sinensis]|uniref:AN1-type zinc finger protein 1-like n=1 Tax=Eriocheir sinensis TaxID=95602 RepID=UPI0021C81756|nr:AN1-type zinc finger protein 1-like [Eriocheir sinensis]